ncbi:pseudouridine synthase [Porphyromonas sp.]|uniref:pseudouridine synthase n=1 Tax=Porphyromonas sp. TaxID=1924944 RepID=UPI0026DDA885|nr:pseudouridine synthase [Porphyromonas sp.]MDO4695304.1 pseudouridine synthase [Porphyromonas sp.]MDO4771033.1 pseudouridine synthase [Porphyromonas sp.]
MGGNQEEHFNQHPNNQQRYDNRYNRPYDNRQGGGFNDRYPRQDRYRNDYGGGYNDRYSSPRMDNYDRRGGGYGNYQSGHDNSQREYYKERYNQARENNRQQFNDRPVYGNDDRYQQNRNNNRRPQPRRGYGQEGYGNDMRKGGYNNNNGKYPQRQQKRSKPGQKFTPRPVPVVYENDFYDENEQIRLNKYLANSGVCSRREADELIQTGAVFVNGESVTELGTKITIKDSVVVNGKEVKPENKVYILLNKPRNCVTTSDDPQERLTVLHLVKNACKERIYPVGRLDRNTTGVLLLTNDGDMASKLVHPSFKKKKIYHVWLDKEVTVEDMQKIADGIELEDGEMHADAISYASEDDHTQVGIEIHSGRNRIVRRIFEHLGYHVYKLDRVYFAGLTKKNLPRGKWRYLSQEEVNILRMGAFE